MDGRFYGEYSAFSSHVIQRDQPRRDDFRQRCGSVKVRCRDVSAIRAVIAECREQTRYRTDAGETNMRRSAFSDDVMFQLDEDDVVPQVGDRWKFSNNRDDDSETFR